MFTKNHKAWLTLFLIFIPLLSAAFLFISYDQRPSRQTPLFLFEKARKAYEENDLKEAHRLIHASPEEILPLEEGCNLLVSVFAEGKDYRNLEKISRLCLSQKRNIAISAEGLAASLVAKKKHQEARKELEALHEMHPDEERITAALAHIYLLNNQIQKSQKLYLSLVHSSKIWTAWLTRILRSSRLTSDVKWTTKLLHTVDLKKDIPPKLYNRLHQLTQNMKNSPSSLS